MQKADQSPRNKEQEYEPSFDDAQYTQDMRVDPLTTRQEVQAELLEIQQKREQREQEKAAAETAAKQKEIEDLKAELDERRQAEVNAK